MSLTDLQIKRLKAPDKGQKTYYDSALAGFGVRVSQGGTKTFVVLYGKERRRKSLGRYPDLSLSEARLLAKQAQVDITLEDLNPKQSAPKVSFKTAREKFLADSETRTKPRTVGEYRRLLNKHFHFEQDISDLSRHDIASVVESLKAKHSEQHHAYVAIRTMMNWCLKRGFLDRSPVPSMTFKTRPRERVLSDKELACVWHRAKAFGRPYGTIVQLLILTGQRKGEVVGLRRSWIADGRIVYPSEFVKNQRSHTIPLGARAHHLIDDLPSKSDLLFPSRFDSEKPFNGFSKCKAAFDQELKVEPYTLHDLRRTFSSNMAKLGTPIHVTERILNHVSGTISGVAAVYNRHAYVDEMSEAFAAHERHLEEVLSRYTKP
ncbi:tyrosine-type recombinase/integrase [Litoreibacter halocynthiae]|uniref:tyrosine-type recombinase/integrase n=1 Tax=Litoreibacter halocynthiae TaxID=1242689 RepID=UPI00248FDC8A|nr:site-specific integrase [Litoreibacter halocynthiae]